MQSWVGIGSWDSPQRLHMLVLIRDWLLAGVSSPWLPSLGGDCNQNKQNTLVRVESQQPCSTAPSTERSQQGGRVQWGEDAQGSSLPKRKAAHAAQALRTQLLLSPANIQET